MAVAKDFIRVFYKNREASLQIDFVNEHVDRIEKVQLIDGFKIDTINEIIANKLGAIISRDEPKDIADILEAHAQGYNSWGKAVDMALSKQKFAVETLILRFETFPVNLLEKIRYVDEPTKNRHLGQCNLILSDVIENIINRHDSLIITP